MLFLLMNPKVSSWNQPAARSRKLAADCLHLYPQRLLPAYWYLIAFLSYASRTEILRLRLRMTMRAGREARNVGSFLRWQSCIGLPSWAKLALSLPIKGPSYELPDRNGAGRSPEEHRIFLAKDLTLFLRCLRHHPLAGL